MSNLVIVEIILAVLATITLVVAAWTELGLSAGTRVDIRRLIDNRLSREDELTIERIQRLRTSMQLLQMLLAAIIMWLVASLAREFIDPHPLRYGLLAGLALLIVFGHLLPAALADTEHNSESSRELRVGTALSRIFSPVLVPILALGNLLSQRSGTNTANDANAGDTDSTAGSGTDRTEAGEIEEDEQEMITGILHLDESMARDIMVPRVDIVAVSGEVLISEAVDVAIQHGHSRIPVYGENIDNILGIVYAKDMLRYVNEPHDDLTVAPLVRPAYIVPETKRTDDLLDELQAEKVHLAIVVDEFGGTSGLVTIEDILEEIVGEIQDEYDSETPQFQVVSDSEAIVDGRLSIDDLSHEMDLDWSGPVSGTVGGIIQRHLGRIPSEREFVELPGLRLTVLSVENRRVRQVKVERFDVDENGATVDDEATSISAVNK